MRTVYFCNISFRCAVYSQPTALAWETLVRLTSQKHQHTLLTHPRNIHCNFPQLPKTDKPASTCAVFINYFALLEWQLQLTDFYHTVVFFSLKMFLQKLNYLGPKYAHAGRIYLLCKLAGAIRIGSSVSAPEAKLIPLLKPCGKQDHASVPAELTLAWLKLLYLFTASLCTRQISRRFKRKQVTSPTLILIFFFFHWTANVLAE